MSSFDLLVQNSPLCNESLHDRSTVAEGDNVIIYVSYGSTHAITVRRGMSLAMKYGALRYAHTLALSFSYPPTQS
jgi:hypothetical protein